MFSLSNPWSSKHRSGTLSKSTTVLHGDYGVDTLKVEIEAVKDRKSRFLVRGLSPQYWSSSRIASKRCFSCILLSHFHFLVSFIWFLSFSYCTKRPHIFFWVLAPDLQQIYLLIVGFWPYLSNQMFCHAVSSFLNLVISWRVHSIYM